MRSALAANLDREHSLEAMRHAFRASKFASRNYVEIDAGVVHALLNARFYNPTQGQFISQDPVFWGDPKAQNLQDPRSINTYGGSKFQDYAYTYDAAGNMTQIANAANALSYATTSFSYDAVNRLLTASTTAASSTPYRQTYSYDLLGSILSLVNGATSAYTYGGTGYANPHALTSLSSGLSTTTYAYDNDGNLTSSGNGTATTTYVWDYANRLIALGSGGATTTYGYDWAGNRVFQTGTTTTFIYPNKFYSVASSTVSGTKYATTTSYVFNGETLLSTIDQQLAGGSATGSAQTRYVHRTLPV